MKGAIVSFIRSLSPALAEKGICIYTVAPGLGRIKIKARFLSEPSLLLQTPRCIHCVVRGQRSFSITSF